MDIHNNRKEMPFKRKLKVWISGGVPMSSFIVQEIVINRIVTFIDNHRYGNSMLSGQVQRALRDYGLNLEDSKDMNKLANSFLLLNKLAVDDRYNEENLLTLTKYKRESTNPCQLLSNMQCLLYQCSEGKVPEMQLYKLLERLIEIVKDDIIERLPEMNKAKWDG